MERGLLFEQVSDVGNVVGACIFESMQPFSVLGELSIREVDSWKTLYPLRTIVF